jgi:hypothetical protein
MGLKLETLTREEFASLVLVGNKSAVTDGPNSISSQSQLLG